MMINIVFKKERFPMDPSKSKFSRNFLFLTSKSSRNVYHVANFLSKYNFVICDFGCSFLQTRVFILHPRGHTLPYIFQFNFAECVIGDQENSTVLPYHQRQNPEIWFRRILLAALLKLEKYIYIL